MAEYLVSESTRRGIEGLLAQQGGSGGAGAPRNLQPGVVLLKVQSGPANSNGYPARLQYWNGTAWVDSSTTTVRLADPNGGTWTAGQYVSCVPHAYGSGGEIRFRPTESAGATDTTDLFLPSDNGFGIPLVDGFNGPLLTISLPKGIWLVSSTVTASVGAGGAVSMIVDGVTSNLAVRSVVVDNIYGNSIFKTGTHSVSAIASYPDNPITVNLWAYVYGSGVFGRIYSDPPAVTGGGLGKSTFLSCTKLN